MSPCLRGSNGRRGVLLLIVLAVLALFALIAVTFVMLASHERHAAEVQARAGQYSDTPPDKLLNEAILQILRGSSSLGSVLRQHSLLEDLYGADVVVGMITGAMQNGNYIDVTVEGVSVEDLARCVNGTLTFLDGPLLAAGKDATVVNCGTSYLTIQPSGTPAATASDLQSYLSSQSILFVVSSLQDRVITNVYPPIAGGQLIPLTFPSASRHVGQVLTPIDGPARGQSTHIVGADPTNPDVVHILAYSNGTLPVAGNRFVLNNSPFSGTGFGYNPNAGLSGNETAPQLDRVDPALSLSTALLPNAPINRAIPGGANEGYDAWDYQNMLPAAQLPEATTIGGVPVPAGTTPIPSMHRSALVNYWYHRLLSNPPSWFTWPPGAVTEQDKLALFLAPYGPTYQRADAVAAGIWDDITVADKLVALKRRILMRPLREDHPNFTGGNPNFNPLWDGYTPQDTNGDGINDCWDVDVDGDGIADSIWIDIGLPVRSMADGRLYKPLVAILCVDLDGRLNLNAHGSLAQVDASYESPTDIGYPYIPDSSGAPTDSLDVPRGQGVGPAGVNLNALFTDTLSPHEEYGRLLSLYVDPTTSETTLGRYGPINAAGSTSPRPGKDLEAEPLAMNKLFDLPDTYDLSSSAAAFLSYGTPLDLHGTMQIGLDLRGQPLYASMYTSQTDNPYEFNLYGPSRGVTSESTSALADAPFTPAELETLLRSYDVDAGTLPDRLSTLAPSLAPHIELDENQKWISIPGHAREVTTDSWDLPVPSVSLPPELRTKTNVATWFPTLKAEHVVDLLRAKLVASNSELDDPTDSADVAALQAMVAALVPPETLAGLRMDLNRPLGNGRDGNSNHVVDEPYEADTAYVQWDANGTQIVTNTLDLDNDGTVGVSYYASERQLFARHLYVLMLTLMDYDATAADHEDIARRAAQWAVNVVDFRDRDAIMTPFEYDIDPFTDEDGDGNPWDIDGVIDTKPKPPQSDDNEAYRGLVWGCERPELILSEALALHDRRTKDTRSDPASDYSSDTPPNPFDQKNRPQGSLFVEILNPSTTAEPKPAEFYETTHGGIDLSKTASDGSPVWRLAVVNTIYGGGGAADLNKDPDSPTDPATIERAAYFVDSSATFPDDVSFRYYRAGQSPIAPILPGRYAVVGPNDVEDTVLSGGDPRNDGVSITCMGQCPNDPDNYDNLRRIELRPSADPTAPGQVKVFANGLIDQLESLEIKNPTAIILSGLGRLSVSEPEGGYPTSTGAQGETYNPAMETYSPPYSRPFDLDVPRLMTIGTSPRMAVVHLQRLANPLLPYDEDTNPYRTIDSMPVDLTVFNGVQDDSAKDSIRLGILEENHLPNFLPSNFFSRERGEEDEGTGESKVNIWSQIPASTASEAPKTQNPVEIDTDGGASVHLYNAPFACTLGYLNEGFQPFWTSADEPDPSNPQLMDFYGSPKQKPFPWLTWLNRPLASGAELMLVPKARSSQLLLAAPIVEEGEDEEVEQKRLPRFTLATHKEDVDTEEVEESKEESYDDDNEDAPFRHLLNFFQNGDWKEGGELIEPDMRLARLLELVRVPSRFTGAELQGNPTRFGGGNHQFHPPFNRISNYREPGRINLNTITSQNVWRGLMNFLPNCDSAWPLFVDSRRGDGTASGEIFTIDDTLPTRFANPFRSFAGKYMVPNSTIQTAIGDEINATILRPLPTDPNRPLFGFTSDQPVNDTDRNPAFRYQLLNRMSSVVTNRSNVYAVWVTVGYFEVTPIAWVEDPSNPGYDVQGRTPAQFAQIYPDGYQLGAELGSELNEIKRHRAFSIIDRSIPVGFQRGKDHNVERAILLRRFIE